MLVLHRKSALIEHRKFSEIPEYLDTRDLLVLNDSKVIPARLHDATGKIEMLLLEKKSENHWVAMVNPGKKMRPGDVVATAGTTATVVEILEDGSRLLKFAAPPDLERYGEMPIPPYFQRTADAADRERYQTVYAREEGSVAAPTAGLHFTHDLLSGLPHTFLTLHVGAGTFRPVKTEDLSAHRMHREYYTLPAEAVHRIAQTKDSGGRVIAVGTTATRVLEAQPRGELVKSSGSTDIFIRPPYRFQRIDGLLTNFHLPGSTLLMLVSAFATRELVLSAYAEAVRKGYRFFSYGDCMLIL
jgi:S-adenosylmethionine:tRNA ribosyltransferase-isomerase